MGCALKTPKYLFFDLGNVLINFDHAQAVDQIAALTGVSHQVVRQIVFDSGLQGRYERGLLDTASYHREFCQLASCRADLQEFVLAASSIFWVNRSVVPLIAMLRAAHVPMGILSNTCDAHWSYIQNQQYNLMGFFSHHILSFQEGVAKPEVHIYQRAADSVGLPPDEIFFVDDRPDNVRGAHAAGLDAVQFQSAGALAAELAYRQVKINY